MMVRINIDPRFYLAKLCIIFVNRIEYESLFLLLIDYYITFVLKYLNKYSKK